MREILFRGKRKDNGDWVEGSLVKYTSEMPTKREEHFRIQETVYGFTDESNIPFFYDYMSGFDEEVIPETVGQYTGLKDKNGNKIFEGDLIDDNVWSVAYCDGEGEFRGLQAGWYVQRDDWESWYGLTYDTLAEVIGNIHDNNLGEER